MYANGQGVPQDDVLALMWLTLGNANGDKDGTIIHKLTIKRMTPTQIAKAQKLAREWRAKHKGKRQR